MKYIIILSIFLSACGITSRVEPYKNVDFTVQEGEQIVLLARRHHANHETEVSFIDCITDKIDEELLTLYPTEQFQNELYPWFEPSLAPLTLEDMEDLLNKPLVLERIQEQSIRYLVWIDGSTERTSSGGGITCAAGVGGAGCFGLAWWEDESNYKTTVWDVQELISTGNIYTDVVGRSVMPALIIPIPLIVRPQHNSCKTLAEQIEIFFTIPNRRILGIN